MPGPRLPEGVLGVKGLARRLKVSETAVRRWVNARVVPAPHFVTGRGRTLWLEVSIERWLSGTTELATCPQCGGRCLSLARHVGAAHSGSRAA